MQNKRKGAVLIEVLVALFITGIVFIGVYTTISVSLINTKYLKQARQTSEFATQVSEAFVASANCSEYSVFDHIRDFYGRAPAMTEIDLDLAQNSLQLEKAAGKEVLNYLELIDEDTLTDYKVQLFLISPNAVYLSENSLDTPFGTGIYSPNDTLMTFELRVQRNSKDWGVNGHSFYTERRPAVISYIFQINRG